jgi:hypothetical protein
MSIAVEETIVPPGIKPELVGTWQLMSAKDLKEGVWVPYTFGNPPSGYFIYDATGHASVQIMTTPKVTLSNPDDGPTPAEALDIFNNYIAYYGTWFTAESITDGKTTQTVTVHVAGALNPEQVDTPQDRTYTVNGDTLTIGSECEGYIRTLQRLV